ncbi:hypothetical protein SP15_249 [Bacillus phage SP-15]|uniref:Uncharacterized protein n=1 Tax=Bacillus phage SP-15 TaxID=1792032 RepID=A0A127AXV9_9CAUD|nr:hypothetical protein SP15_249 [Bacillus phage SP-15]AMM45054.1 hypothetical protein SP15_249 [Bacillus phage SP-15]
MNTSGYKWIVIHHPTEKLSKKDDRVHYLNNDRELVKLLKEIAKEHGVKIESSDDVIEDVMEAVSVFSYVTIFDARDKRHTFGFKLLDHLFDSSI